MKKLLALVLAVVMISSSIIVATASETFEITDEFLSAVQVEYYDYKISKEDITISKSLSFDSIKSVVVIDVEGYNFTDTVVKMGLGGYILSSVYPVPMIYFDGKLYDLETAYYYAMLSDRDLELMYNSGLFDMEKTKIHLDIYDAMEKAIDDEYITIRFEVVGSDKDISDFWAGDVSSSADKLYAHYEEIHNKLINEVLKDIDHIDHLHNDGYSVVSLKKADIEKVAENDFILMMDYISDIQLKYINTFDMGLDNYKYRELYTQLNDDSTKQYEIIEAHSRSGASAVIGFRMGDSIIYSGSIYSNFKYGYGIYDYKEDRFIDLFELRNENEQYKHLENLLIYLDIAKPVANTDGDRLMTIMDATNVQRYLAKLDFTRMEHFVNHEYNEYCGFGDIDNDGTLSAIDATMIQQLVAKM